MHFKLPAYMHRCTLTVEIQEKLLSQNFGIDLLRPVISIIVEGITKKSVLNEENEATVLTAVVENIYISTK